MASYFYGHPIPRTDRQCTRPGKDAELLGGRPTLVCTHTTRLSRRGRTPYPWFGLVWPHTSMATQFRARTASARGPVGMRNCWGGRPTLVCTHTTRLSRRGRTPCPWFGLLWPHTSMATQFRARTASARGQKGMRNCWEDARHWFAPTPPACRVGDARRARGLDFLNVLAKPRDKLLLTTISGANRHYSPTLHPIALLSARPVAPLKKCGIGKSPPLQAKSSAEEVCRSADRSSTTAGVQQAA